MPTYLVTGANRGLGLEFARQLTTRGDRVIGTARDPSQSRELAATRAQIIPLDLGQPESIQAALAAAGDAPIDALINNAGVNSPGKRLAGLQVPELEAVLRVNALGPLFVTKALLPRLRAGSQKKIINIS